VYEKAKSAFPVRYANSLDSFDEYIIKGWQQEFDAQAETMPEPAPVKPEKAAADKPMAAPKQPASRKKAVTAPEPPVQPAPVSSTQQRRCATAVCLHIILDGGIL
jgi:hypothetical protein